jgi:hypothetical protein
MGLTIEAFKNYFRVYYYMRRQLNLPLIDNLVNMIFEWNEPYKFKCYEDHLDIFQVVIFKSIRSAELRDVVKLQFLFCEMYEKSYMQCSGILNIFYISDSYKNNIVGKKFALNYMTLLLMG